MFVSTKRNPQGSAPAREMLLKTGDIVNPNDPDQLIDLYSIFSGIADKYTIAKRQLAYAIADLTKGTKKTRRLEGKTRRAKVEMPDERFNQGILKEAWNSFPQHRDRALSISSLRVKKRELKKLQETAGPADLEQFARMLLDANQGPSGTPRITVEY